MGSISISLTVVEPIELLLSTASTVYIGTSQAGPKGEKGDTGDTGATGPAWEIEYATKQTGVDAGTLGQAAFDDDYFYLCVIPGEVGVAIWKRSVLFQT